MNRRNIYTIIWISRDSSKGDFFEFTQKPKYEKLKQLWTSILKDPYW